MSFWDCISWRQTSNITFWNAIILKNGIFVVKSFHLFLFFVCSLIEFFHLKAPILFRALYLTSINANIMNWGPHNSTLGNSRVTAGLKKTSSTTRTKTHPKKTQTKPNRTPTQTTDREVILLIWQFLHHTPNTLSSLSLALLCMWLDNHRLDLFAWLSTHRLHLKHATSRLLPPSSRQRSMLSSQHIELTALIPNIWK